MVLINLCYVIVIITVVNSQDIQQPNIVFIVADDLGWDDVSFHGSDQIMTPNIDILAYQGIILQQYYTDTLGTASRSALFTGKYPMRLGTQSFSITPSEDRGVPSSERLLPSYLRKLGYATHLVGKWHVGKSREHYLPTYRGFDTFYGFLDGSVDYYTYNLIENRNATSFFGLDLFDDTEPVEGQTGHLTDVLTERAVKLIRKHNISRPLYLHVSHAAPHTGGGLINLQPPVNTIQANDHIAHSARRMYAGLVTSLDNSVGRIIEALAESEILQNTLIIFVSDNGAASTGLYSNFGSNLPLRGIKNTPWDGAARSAAILWHASLSSKIWKGLFHVTDWLPTLITAAGGNFSEKIDGVNQWNSLTKDEKSQRSDILITVDDLNGWAALREGKFKIIVGEVCNHTSNYYGQHLKKLRREAPSYIEKLLESDTYRILTETLRIPFDIDTALVKRNDTILVSQTNGSNILCIPNKAKGCLFNIIEDPLESNDLWYSSPEIVKHLALRLRTLWAELYPRRRPISDSRADPSIRNYVWSPWIENNEKLPEPPNSRPPFPLQVSKGELQYLVDLNLNMFRDRLYDYVKNMGDSFVQSITDLFSS